MKKHARTANKQPHARTVVLTGEQLAETRGGDTGGAVYGHALTPGAESLLFKTDRGRGEGLVPDGHLWLAARGLALDTRQRRRIRRARDAAQLERWIIRAARARTIADVLADD